jgi:hypothetical protein
MFGCEAWSMAEKDKIRLNMWERKILRKVYEPVLEQGVWRIRRNEELRQLYKVYGPVTEQGVWRIRRNEELKEPRTW